MLQQSQAQDNPAPQAHGGNQQMPQLPPGQIAITQEQYILIQQLISSPAFNNLRQQAMTNPESLPALLQMLQQNYPSLSALFHQNPQLLIAILAGQFDGGNAQMDPIDDEGEDYGEAPVNEALTAEDNQKIQQV
jgi:DNA-binding transcriptional LysR family regulator